MDEIPDDAARTSPILTMTLGQLCDLSIEERCALLLRYDRSAFESALRTVEQSGAPVKMNLGRLAWAVAFNIDGFSGRNQHDGLSQRSARSYLGHWSPDTAWAGAWSVLIKPLVQDDAKHSASLLSELALSVACEQRNEWQNPSFRPIDSDAANRTFECVYKSNRMKVIRSCSRFPHVAGDLEAIADEAWSRVFSDYWSAYASRRFLGLSRISTLVCQVARFVAIDSFRSNARLRIGDEEGSDGQATRVADPIDLRPGPLAHAVQNQLESKIRECMVRLPAKARIVAEMVWLREINANQVAQILKVSEPAISQHLRKARDIVGICLKEHGFSLPS